MRGWPLTIPFSFPKVSYIAITVKDSSHIGECGCNQSHGTPALLSRGFLCVLRKVCEKIGFAFLNYLYIFGANGMAKKRSH